MLTPNGQLSAIIDFGAFGWVIRPST
ncbi:hypothetical protein ABZX92_12500 [Lentzea sp. NPDC006480]